MMRATKILVLIVAAAALVTGSTGCNKKRPTRPPLDENAVIGTWAEPTSAEEVNPRAAGLTAEKYHRKIEMKADHTFVFTILTKSGKTAGTIEGNWKLNPEKNIIEFEVTSSTLSASSELNDWAPATSIGVYELNVKGKGVVQALSITDKLDNGFDLFRE